MKLQKAINIIKKSAVITLFQDENGTRLLSNGNVVYDVSRWPYIESIDELAAILNIADMDKYSFAIKPIPDICRPASNGIPVDKKYITIEYGGTEYTFFSTSSKIIVVKSKYLLPFDEEIRFEYANNEHGEIIVAGGFIKEGYILPIKVDDGFRTAIEEIYRGI